MALIIPPYIQASGIDSPFVRYKWDDWNVPETYTTIADEGFYEHTKVLSHRAALALAIASAEWVLYRFDKLCQDRLPYLYIEAAWASVVDAHYLIRWEPAAKDWAGPVRGPIAAAIVIVQHAVTTAVYEDAQGIPLSYISNLVTYVLPDPAPFLNWRDRMTVRLERLYPFDPKETLGEVVPREALDPDFNFDPALTESLINRFLQSLDPQTNPFLFKGHVMLEQKFEGQPYVFNIEEDREKRFEW